MNTRHKSTPRRTVTTRLFELLCSLYTHTARARQHFQRALGKSFVDQLPSETAALDTLMGAASSCLVAHYHRGRTQLLDELRAFLSSAFETLKGPIKEELDAIVTELSSPIRWWLLADLMHEPFGLTEARIEALVQKFQKSVEARGQPDLLILAGGLTYHGAPREFEQVDQLLERLARDCDIEPLVVPVPGPRELQRPSHDELRFLEYRVIDRFRRRGWSPELDEFQQMFTRGELELVNELFEPYARWFEESLVPRYRARPDVCFHAAPLVGDHSIEWRAPNDVVVELVALNSVWTCYREYPPAIPPRVAEEQLEAALVGGADWRETVAVATYSVLVQHHSPRALTDARYLNHTWNLCLHGPNRDLPRASRDERLRYPTAEAVTLSGDESPTSQDVGFISGHLSADGEVSSTPVSWAQ